MLALLGEAGIEVTVPVQGVVHADVVACAQLADAGFEEVLFYGPAHQVVVDAGFGDAFVEFAGGGVLVDVYMCEER